MTITRRPLAITLMLALTLPMFFAVSGQSAEPDEPGVVRVANLIYARNKSSQCFADHFLADVEAETHVTTARSFDAVHLESEELYDFPFAIMTGEGAFTLTPDQRENLRSYLTNGGFLVASAGCSSQPWKSSFRREIARVFSDVALEPIPSDHAVFSTVYEIDELKTKRTNVTGELEGLIVDGRIVAIFSEQGLNDTANAGSNCCCCGGNEITNARQMNVNLLTYALTH
ncbi:MAG: DUF4159 domain-containing protein [Phycisphaeraceae bacterium]